MANPRQDIRFSKVRETKRKQRFFKPLSSFPTSFSLTTSSSAPRVEKRSQQSTRQRERRLLTSLKLTKPMLTSLSKLLKKPLPAGRSGETWTLPPEAASFTSNKSGNKNQNKHSSCYFKHPHRLADLIERDSTTLANLETLDNGKPFEDSIFDIQCAVDTLR